MSRLRSISIGTRLAVAFGLVTLACALVALVGFRGAGSLSGKSREQVALAGSFLALDDLSGAVDTTAADVVRHLYVYDGDAAKEDQIASEIADLRKQADGAYAQVAEVHADNVDLL
jgi:hypothetical protein